MAEIRHLPFYWDEITDDKHRELVAKIMHEASDGVQKGGNSNYRTTRDRGMWKLMIMAAGNQSYREFLYKRNKNHSASVMRVLEWHVARVDTGPGQLQDAVATALLNETESNYGEMGKLYAAFLAQNHLKIKDEVIAEANKVEAFYGTNSEERYWQSGVATMICAARYAKQLGLDVDPREIKDFMYEVYRKNREEQVKRGMRGGLIDNAETVLTLYLKERHAAERVIWTNYMHDKPGKPPKAVTIMKGPIQARNTQGGIEGRFAIENNKLIIANSDFKVWLDEHEYQQTPIYDVLEKDYGAKFDRLQLASGTVHNIGREPCIVIDVKPNSPLGEFMLMYASEAERTAAMKQEGPQPVETGFAA